MRAVLTNLGSTGDIWPFLALAVELRRAGHEPLMAIPPNFAALARSFDLPFTPVGPEFDLEKIRNVVAAIFAAPDSAEQTRPLLASALESLPQMFRELLEICQDADVIICGTAQPAGRMVHEKIEIPFVSLHTVSFALWSTTSMRKVIAPMINYYRAQAGLRPLRDPIVADAHSPQLALHPISRHVLRRPLDWPAQYQVVGYFFLDNDAGWAPDPALEEFIAAGDPPVVIDFGSMIHGDPEALTDLVLAAIARAGCRAIIQRGWSGLGNRQLPPEVHVIGFAPHNWIFPRAGCIVHHGATGTTGATLRAGVPAVVVPHAYEHPLNALIARELHCAGPAIPYSRLTAERLGSAIATTLASSQYHQAAAALSQKIRAEQGVQTACRLIEQLVDS